MAAARLAGSGSMANGGTVGLHKGWNMDDIDIDVDIDVDIDIDSKKLDDLCWSSFFLWFGVGGQSCPNCLASAVDPGANTGIESSRPDLKP